MKRTIETKYFVMEQNNAGGHYDLKGKANAHVVIVEALDEQDALRRAKDDFDLDLDFRHEFSGERWGTSGTNSATPEPLVAKAMAEHDWIEDLVVSVCHLDGSVEFHEKIPGHVRGLSEKEAEVLVKAIPAECREIKRASLDHRCDVRGFGCSEYVVRDTRSGQVFFLCSFAAQRLFGEASLQDA